MKRERQAQFYELSTRCVSLSSETWMVRKEIDNPVTCWWNVSHTLFMDLRRWTQENTFGNIEEDVSVARISFPSETWLLGEVFGMWRQRQRLMEKASWASWNRPGTYGRKEVFVGIMRSLERWHSWRRRKEKNVHPPIRIWVYNKTLKTISAVG